MAEETPLLAGKYKDQPALEQAIREGVKATSGVELPATAVIIGEGGIFPNVDAAVAGYKATESNLGKLKAPPPKSDVAPLSAALTAPAREIDDPAEAVKAAGIDWDELEATVTKDGKPSDAHYAALKGVGWNRAAVNAYIAGETAKKQAGGYAYAAAVNAAGGEEAINALIAAAKPNVPASEAARIAKMLDSPTEVGLAVRLLKSYTAPSKPDFTVGGAGSPGSNIETLAEYQSHIRAAAGGDAAAIAALKRFDTSKIGSLK